MLAGAGWRVVATARRTERLEALAEETGCAPLTLDVTDAEAVRAVGRSEPFDLVVNNAGLGRAMGAIWEASDDDVDRTIETNVTGLVNMTRAVLPGMIERGRGHIVNISSVLALYPGPAALYGATKGAVRMLSQDLRQELRGTGIRITEICPGRVATEFYDVALDDPARGGSGEGHRDPGHHPGRCCAGDPLRRQYAVAGQCEHDRDRADRTDLRRLPVHPRDWVGASHSQVGSNGPDEASGS